MTAGPAAAGAPTDGDTLTASFAQRLLWFLDQLAGHSTGSMLPLVLRLRGSLDVPRLERALSGIVDRHEVLRTRFTSVGGEPVPVVDAPGGITLICGDDRVTYADLDGMTGGLAAALKAAGIGSGSPVGVLLRRRRSTAPASRPGSATPSYDPRTIRWPWPTSRRTRPGPAPSAARTPRSRSATADCSSGSRAARHFPRRTSSPTC
ncbi:condensation domain-containing protein [Streptomyces sp. NPDC058755]|uniref:condensation domain-containing protein n=1 Tax=Streptomyces sp. NPDC058755 TaxID=3346624 RepID=UPI00367C80F3